MLRWLVLILLVGGAYQHYQNEIKAERFQPVKAIPYVIVYGRQTCGFTQRQRDALRSAGIAYQFKSVDERHIADGLHQRMYEQGLNIRRYDLPVVDVNGQLKVRPDVTWTEQEYKRNRG